MKQDTAVWQTKGHSVFKLKESGKHIFVDTKGSSELNENGTLAIKQRVPELVNDVYIRVSIQNQGNSEDVEMKEILLAEKIAKVLNEHLKEI